MWQDERPELLEQVPRSYFYRLNFAITVGLLSADANDTLTRVYDPTGEENRSTPHFDRTCQNSSPTVGRQVVSYKGKS